MGNKLHANGVYHRHLRKYHCQLTTFYLDIRASQYFTKPCYFSAMTGMVFFVILGENMHQEEVLLKLMHVLVLNGQ